MAELMDDDVISQVKRKTRDAIVEIEITSLGTTPPSRPLIAYRDPVVGEAVQLVEDQKPMMHKHASSHPKRRIDVLCVTHNMLFLFLFAF